jgi:hypothetical protein
MIKLKHSILNNMKENSTNIIEILVWTKSDLKLFSFDKILYNLTLNNEESYHLKM